MTSIIAEKMYIQKIPKNPDGSFNVVTADSIIYDTLTQWDTLCTMRQSKKKYADSTGKIFCEYDINNGRTAFIYDEVHVFKIMVGYFFK